MWANTQFLFSGVGNAFQATPPSMNQSSANAGSNPSSGPANYDSQLATMREMGITDEGMARRALEVMGGDVQAAIDLIYSGWEGAE